MRYKIAAIVGAVDKREMFQSIVSYSGRQQAQIWIEAIAFCRLWRRSDMGPTTAVWRRINAELKKWPSPQPWRLGKALALSAFLSGT
jgi:hypothetical protein